MLRTCEQTLTTRACNSAISDPAATSIPIDLARRFRATTGTAEEVVAMRPELVIASSFTSPATPAIRAASPFAAVAQW